MTGVQAGALAVAVAAPLSGALLSRRQGVPDPRLGVSPVPQLGATAAALAWLVLVAGGASGRVAGFHFSPLVAAAGCGAALLTTAVLSGLSSRRSVVATGAALTAVGLGLTAGGAGTQAVALVAGLAVAALLAIGAIPRAAAMPRTSAAGPSPAATGSSPAATVERSSGHRPGTAGRSVLALLAAAGIVACAFGFVEVHSRDGTWTLPAGGTRSLTAVTAFVVAAALLSAAGALGRRHPTAVLLPAGLAVGLLAAPIRAGTDELGVLVVALAAAAIAAVGTRQATLGIALLALALAVGPVALTPASRLLAAAAVIIMAVDRPWACLAAVPGGVSLVAGVIDDGSRLSLGVALAAAVVALLLGLVVSESSAWSPPPDEADGDRQESHGAWLAGLSGAAAGLPFGAWPAVLTGAWLAVAPGTWSWTGADLDVYDQGMARAVGAGLLVVVAWALVRWIQRRPKVSMGHRPEAVPARRPEAPSAPPALSLTPASPTPEPSQLVPSERSASTPRPRRAFRSQRARPRGRFSARTREGSRRRRPPSPDQRQGPTPPR